MSDMKLTEFRMNETTFVQIRQRRMFFWIIEYLQNWTKRIQGERTNSNCYLLHDWGVYVDCRTIYIIHWNIHWNVHCIKRNCQFAIDLKLGRKKTVSKIPNSENLLYKTLYIKKNSNWKITFYNNSKNKNFKLIFRFTFTIRSLIIIAYHIEYVQ